MRTLSLSRVSLSEIRPAILQHDAGAGRHDARAERLVEALDHAQHIAAPVGHDKARGVALRIARLIGLRLAGIEEVPPLVRVALVEELGDGQARVLGVGHPAIAVGIGDLGHLEQEVQVLH